MKTKNQHLSWSAAILLVLGLGLTPTAFAQDDLTKELNAAIQNIVEKHKRELAEQRAKSDRRIQELEREAAQLRSQVADLRTAMEQMRRANASETPSRPARPVDPARPATGVEVAPSGGADRPFLGVALAPPSEEHLKKLGIERGIQVTQVVPDTPAQRVGLKADDVVTSVGGKPVDFESFSGVLGRSKAGDRVALEYSRLVDNQPVRFEARVKLGRRGDFVPSEGGRDNDDDSNDDDDDGNDVAPVAPAPPAAPVKLGARVRQEAENNLVIVDVTAGSNAAEAGLREGDQLLSIGDARMATIDTVKESLGKIKSGQTQSLSFRRDGNVHRVNLRWGAGSTKPSLLDKRVSGGNDRAAAEPKPAAPKKRGFLGVSVDPSSGSLLIDEVVPASAAATMGLKVGDAITHVNGKSVSDIEALGSMLGGMHAGDTVKIKVKRGDGSKTLEGKLGALDDGAPEQAAAEAEAPAIAEAPMRPVVGIEVREYGDVLEISEVFVGSAAERAGLAVGDKLIALGGTTLERLEDIGSVLDARVPGDRLRAEVLRGDSSMKIELTLGAH